VLQAEGVRHGLGRHWAQIEALQEQFTCTQIAWIFEQCSREHTVDTGVTRRGGLEPVEAPTSAKLVQLFSNFVCERMTELTPAQITTFVVALTSQALPMDEFWLFMMAKRIQDTAAAFSPEEVTAIARRYAAKALEDDEFFEALVQRILSAPQEFTPAHLAHFLLSCAKVRYLQEELCELAFPLFERPDVAVRLSAESAAAALTAAGYFGERSWRAAACCTRLAAVARARSGSSLQGPSSFANPEFVMGLVLASVSLQRSTALRRQLLPCVLTALREGAAGARVNGRNRRELATFYRRVVLMGWCVATDVPHGGFWSLPLLRQVNDTLATMEDRLSDLSARDTYEPTPSSFHLEVVAVLRLLSTEHALEQPQPPFCLDITISPEQLSSGMRMWPQTGR